RVAVTMEAERLAKRVDHEEVDGTCWRRAQGSIASSCCGGQQHGQCEILHGSHDGKYQLVEDDGCHQRNGYMTQGLKASRAVDPGSFFQSHRDALQSGQEDDHP